MPYSTQQRSTLAQVISKSQRPLTPVENRTLKQLVEDGQVRVVDVPGVPPHYESSARQHHHFFFCHQCQRLFNLIGCVRGVLGLAPKGFSVERHEIVLYGDCADCRRGA